MSDRLQAFVGTVEQAVASQLDEEALLAKVRAAMATLVATDDWLPDSFAQPHPIYYQQYLLHRDPQDRFSVVSFVWGPGQHTPIHDHTVWGVIGMLRGSETAQNYERQNGKVISSGAAEVLRPGDVALVSPRIGDIHQVSNALADQVSISIHAYGADIGSTSRHVFDATTGEIKTFISGYANAPTPDAGPQA